MAKLTDDIIEIIGKDQAYIFFNHYRGQSLYLFVGKHHCVHGLRQESWNKLCIAYDRQSILIPMGDKNFYRNQEIKSFRKKGLRLNDLAKHFNLTIRQVINICNTNE